MAYFWNKLENTEQLETIKQESVHLPVLIFKHSTRCSISDAALSRIERQWHESYFERMKLFYLDLIAFRPVSNAVAQLFGIEHQSPQVLLIKDGKCVYHASHFDIQMEDILSHLN
jgi:bacillithiol system protein YtxJ